MNTNEKEPSKRLNPLVSFGVFLIVFLIRQIPVIEDYYTHRPVLWYDPNVAETGNYLSTEENFYVSDDNQTHMGDRYLLSCKLSHKPEETKNGYTYGFVDDVCHDERQFMLISDEQLPTGKYLQLDGLVSGYYYVKYKTNGGQSGRYFTVLKVTAIKKTGGKRIDYAAPLERTEEPNCSVSQDGITFSLDKIEYRGPISRVFITLKTPVDRYLYQYDLNFKSEGQQLSGTFSVGYYIPPYEISSYCSAEDTVFLPTEAEPDSVYHGIMVIKTPDPGEAIYANYKYYAYTKEEGLPHNISDKVSLLQLMYQPEIPAGE